MGAGTRLGALGISRSRCTRENLSIATIPHVDGPEVYGRWPFGEVVLMTGTPRYDARCPLPEPSGRWLPKRVPPSGRGPRVRLVSQAKAPAYRSQEPQPEEDERRTSARDGRRG